MPTIILKQKITKGYEHWLAAFDGAEDLNPKWLIKHQRVGITAGASAPESLVQNFCLL